MSIELKQISDLFNSHCSRSFPEGFGGSSIKGIDLVMLDADTVGIVQRFLGYRHNKGELEQKWQMILKELQKEAEKVCKEISEDGKSYFNDIRLMIEWTLSYLENKTDI